MDSSDVKILQGYEGHTEDQNIVIFEREGEQVRMTVSEFRGNMYFGFRVWLQDINENWFPTKAGFSWPYNLSTTSSVFKALTHILSRAEVLSEVFARMDEVELKHISQED
ncbi:transcriptional co-activator [Serratia phage Slocum]|nr:transcriptional co-activator [Serratia phage Slocum]